MTKRPVLFEMETSDPDDFMTLLWLADHPGLDLQGVVVTPGSRDQCQLVRWGLDGCGRTDAPVGALHGPKWWTSQDGTKPRVSGFHYKVYGEAILSHAVGEVLEGPALLAALLRQDPHQRTALLVGSAPKNTGRLLRDDEDVIIPYWVQQGGFAGDNLVSEPLPKFRGRLTWPSFNPGGAPKETLALLASPRVGERLFVSKNVCHGVVWDGELQRALKERSAQEAPRPGRARMIHALDRYLEDKGVGKAMHELVAAACLVDEGVCGFTPVSIYREKGEWGALAAPGSRTRISVSFRQQRFVEVLAT